MDSIQIKSNYYFMIHIKYAIKIGNLINSINIFISIYLAPKANKKITINNENIIIENPIKNQNTNNIVLSYDNYYKKKRTNFKDLKLRINTFDKAKLVNKPIKINFGDI